MKKKYNILDDIMDTFFLFRNPNFTPVKIIALSAFFVFLLVLILIPK